ncbi:MAG: uncharacterized protein QG559_607 [Campylobacterota bacterium]|nr:uncharacterized protein [Campylobacterota bacterium]
MSLQIGWNHINIKELSINKGSFSNELSGIKIAFLSDLHLKKKIPLELLRGLIDTINTYNVDLVLFGGDIIEQRAKHLKEHIKLFEELKAKGYFVTGNHDIVYGAKELEFLMQKSGIECIDNQIAKLQIKGAQFQLVGLGDRYSFLRGIKRPVKELFLKLDPNLPTILLTHQPKDSEHIKEHRIDIQLSGHTHGGQIYPLTYLVKLFQPFFSGLYRYRQTDVYVSNGVGYWGVDVRYKALNEVVILTIN